MQDLGAREGLFYTVKRYTRVLPRSFILLRMQWINVGTDVYVGTNSLSRACMDVFPWYSPIFLAGDLGLPVTTAPHQ